MKITAAGMTYVPNGTRLKLVFRRYPVGGRIAIQAFEAGEPSCTFTVNLPNYPLAEGEVFIKDYSENEGATQCLIAAGVIQPPATQVVESGHVVISSYKLTPAALHAAEKGTNQ